LGPPPFSQVSPPILGVVEGRAAHESTKG